MPRKLIEPNFYQIPQDRIKLFRADSYTNPGGTAIRFLEHPVVKYTPSGAWISTWGHERFVNLRAMKQYASTTKDEALDQLKHRKRGEIKILSHRLGNAEKTLELLAAGKLESDNYSELDYF